MGEEKTPPNHSVVLEVDFRGSGEVVGRSDTYTPTTQEGLEPKDLTATLVHLHKNVLSLLKRINSTSDMNINVQNAIEAQQLKRDIDNAHSKLSNDQPVEESIVLEIEQKFNKLNDKYPADKS